VKLTEGRYGERQVSLQIDPRIHKCYEAALRSASRASVDLAYFTLELPLPLMRELGETLRKLERGKGCLIVANPAPRPEGQRMIVPPVEVLRLADILTPNRFEAAFLAEEPQPETPSSDLARRLNEIFGVDESYITFGADGWTWACAGTPPEQGAHALERAAVVDKVGASDVFTAVVGVARRAGASPRAASLAAGAAARLAVSRSGGAEAFPTRDELLSELKDLSAEEPDAVEAIARLKQLP
jgi:sugar/nucleoside kinase (ribokinase family)